MKTANIGNFKLGIDMKSEETEMPRGAVRDAVNVDITANGGVRRRPGMTKLAAFTGGHSLWSSRSRTFALFGQADAMRRIVLGNDGAVGVSTVLTGLHTSDKISYTELESRTVFTNGYELAAVDADGSSYLLGVSDPAGAPLVVAGTGGLLPGRYGCAYSFMNARGEESGLSPAAFIDSTTGGIAFTLPPAPVDVTAIRVYTTPVNGDVFYQMAEVPAGLLSVNVGDDTPGKAATTQYMHRMLGGELVRVFKGRVMVANATTLVFSEPFNYGLTSRRHNFIQFELPIMMLEAVEGGVYVGLASVVYFLEGSGPGDFRQNVASSNAPVPGASTLLEAAQLPEDLQKLSDAPVAVWLGRTGYSIGLPSGLVRDVQNERITLPEYAAGSTVPYAKNGLTQLISVVQSEQSNGVGSAIDSIT